MTERMQKYVDASIRHATMWSGQELQRRVGGVASKDDPAYQGPLPVQWRFTEKVLWDTREELAKHLTVEDIASLTEGL